MKYIFKSFDDVLFYIKIYLLSITQDLNLYNILLLYFHTIYLVQLFHHLLNCLLNTLVKSLFQI